MVDCRLCRNHYTIYGSEIDDVNKYVCLAKEVFIEREYVSKGPCDLYDDVDGHDTED